MVVVDRVVGVLFAAYRFRGVSNNTNRGTVQTESESGVLRYTH